jgi:hypothetical protein
LGALRRQLSDLLLNVGAADDGTVAGAWFREEANKAIDHARLARQFAAIAKSRAPLDHPLCVGNVRKELAAAARLEWPERVPSHSGKIIRGASDTFCPSALQRSFAASQSL